MSTVESANEMLSCPYNTSHQVERYRFQYHIEKCRKQHPRTPMKSCPFDASHLIPEGEMDFHISVCPKRAMFDRMKFNVENGVEFRPTVESVAPPVVSGENWENCNYSTYQPDTTKKILRKAVGMTPAERRKARMEGIQNFNSRDNQ